MTERGGYGCAEAFTRLDDYVDRELSPEEMRLVEEHLQLCATCAGEFAFEASVIEEVRAKLRRLDVSTDLVDRIARELAAARSRGGEQG